MSFKHSCIILLLVAMISVSVSIQGSGRFSRRRRTTTPATTTDKGKSTPTSTKDVLYIANNETGNILVQILFDEYCDNETFQEINCTECGKIPRCSGATPTAIVCSHNKCDGVCNANYIDAWRSRKIKCVPTDTINPNAFTREI